MNFLKKAILTLTGAAALTSTKAADLEKTTQKLPQEINKTIAYKAPEKSTDATINFADAKAGMEQAKTLKQEMEQAQQELIKTQMEFKAEIAKLLKIHAHDPMVTAKLNEISDISAKATIFATGFMKDRMENLDSAKIAEYVEDAITFAKSPTSNMFFKETAAMKDLSKETVLGSVILQDGFNTETDRVESGMVVSKIRTAQAFLGGQNDILDRLIAANIMFIAKKAAAEKPSTIDQAINNIDHLASK